MTLQKESVALSLPQQKTFFPAIISPPAISLIGVEDDAVNIPKLNLTNREANNNNLRPVAIKMQTFTLNVDSNHFNFVPNEA